MVSLVSSRSWSSIRSAFSDTSGRNGVPPSPSASSTSSLGAGSSGSSGHSLNTFDDENVTITVSASSIKKQIDDEDELRTLTTSSRITELQYAISDLQTRIFEVQELRHKSHAAGEPHGASDIDTALSSLDERLESVSAGIKAVNETMEPLLHSQQTPTQAYSNPDGEEAALVRKHSALLDEWQTIQRDADLLREELREDKWLTVFRTVTDQADGMMNSLDKAIKRCQDFLRHMNAGGPIPPSLWPPDPERAEGVVPNTVDIFIALGDTFEAKKRHYIPATNKVLSILDKGVQERVTKNGECLRRHTESTQRWKALQARLARTDAEMDKGRAYLLRGETTPSEGGSSASGSTAVSARNGHLDTPGSSRGASKSTLALSRSMSPLRKMARKLKGGGADPDTPRDKGRPSMPVPGSEPVKTLRKQRTSLFGFRTVFPTSPTTPDKPGHRQTQSVAQVETPPSRRSEAGTTPRHGLGPMSHAPAWNSSVKVEEDRHERERTATLRPTPPRRPSAMGFYQSLASLSPGGMQTPPDKRSHSRSSMASSSVAPSSRPWSPITNNSSTTSSIIPPMPAFRAPSRQYSQIAAPPHTPRSRPKTPSAIPVPRTAPARIPSSSQPSGPSTPERQHSREGSYFPDTPSRAPPPRPPSRSMIPMPSLHLTSASRPGTAMSAYDRSDTSMSMRAGPSIMLSRSSMGVPPPSAFRESSRTPSGMPSGLMSRPGSRGAGARTGAAVFGTPVHLYTPAKGGKDPLDAAVAAVTNSVPHVFVVERVDAPLKTAPEANIEQRATYAFSNALGRKQLPLKYTAPGKTGDRRLLYRAGGGWNELREYLVAHPA